MTDAVATIRRFNRVWTPLFGLLDTKYLGSNHTLLESRVLFEPGQESPLERMTLRERLNIDESYLSRALNALVRRELVQIESSITNRRRMTIALAAIGRRTAKQLGERFSEMAIERLAELSEGQLRPANEASTVVPRLLRGRVRSHGDPRLRAHPPGAGALETARTQPRRCGAPRTGRDREVRRYHQPLYRQSVIYAREGVELSRSTLADWVGGVSALLRPLHAALKRYVTAIAALYAVEAAGRSEIDRSQNGSRPARHGLSR